MTTAREKMLHAQTKLSQNPKQAGQLTSVYRFVLSGDGGGTWIASFRGVPSLTEDEGQGDKVDCTIKMEAQDYVDLLEGKVEPQQLFFSGKLQVEGDVEAAMKLQAIQEILR